MPEQVVLEAEAVEEPSAGEAEAVEEPSRLPQRSPRTDAAGGLVAGAATVAAVRAVRSGPAPRRQRSRRLLRRRQDPPRIIASRSFMVDVHILGER
jgi:hypothetical protein